MPALILILLAGGLVILQIAIGGARLVDALPAYLGIAAAGLGVIALRKTPRVRPDLLCLASTVAFVAFVVGRAMLSPIPYLARPDLFMSLGALVVYLVCALYLSDPEHRFRLTLILMLAGIAHVALGIFQFKDQFNFMLLPWIFRPDYGFRASGFYISPNHLAALLGMLALLTLSICCWSRVALSTRVFAFYGFVACLTGLALTGSRGGYLSTALGLALFAALSVFLAKRFNRPNFFGVAMATAFVLTGVVALTLVLVVRSEVYEKRLRHVQVPTRQAALLAPAARQQHQLDPAFGTGSGTFLYYGREFHGPAVQNDPQHAHHEYRELLAEYGWTGGVFFAVFLLAHLRVSIRGLFRILDQKLKPTAGLASNELALLVGAACALLVGLVHASRDFTFHLPGNALVAAFLFAILANPTVETVSRGERRVLAPWLAGLAPAVALLLLALSAWRLPAEVLAERARLALRDQDYPAACDLARRAGHGDSANPDARYVEGEALRYLALHAADAGRAASLRGEAALAFENGLKIFPRDVRLLLKLGQVRDDLGEFPQADELFARALAAAPDSGTVQAACGIHWHRQWRLEKAGCFYRNAQLLGESLLSTAGLRDLERDAAVLRSKDAFAELLPDRPSEPESSAIPQRR